MIQFTLKCDKGHRFDSWFQSSATFDKLKAAGMVSCDLCGSSLVEKALMAPAVSTAPRPDPRPEPRPEPRPNAAPASPPPPSLAPATDMEKALADLRRQVEANSDYVGMNFAAEARAMHEGTAPERAIYGEANPEEAKKLIEDGVPVTPLPFLPKPKTN